MMDTRLLDNPFGHTHSHVLARLGRFLPSPYMHFGSPIAPYSVPLAAAHHAAAHHHFDYGQAAAAAAAMAGGVPYSIDGILSMAQGGMAANGMGGPAGSGPGDHNSHGKKGRFCFVV
ncbi:hypothetical protein JTE90_018079 [Oedothorax gibbosus]|uniref:Uncharacterized protein n=1 Tax=Oedothorax gibbosus TaxID=931172 RepID=A0AAV6UC04_9ARAC|nr:hypothetical protein JTE90_018079 [Oedothorax gibbosus]